MSLTKESATRVTLLIAISLSFLLMSLKVLLYRSLFAMPGGPAFVIGTGGLLVLYAVLVFWLTRRDGETRRIARLVATPLGLVGAAIQIANLARENLVQSGPLASGISSMALMFATFAVWGIAGYRAARSRKSAWAGVLAGLWSAVITISAVVLFGFVLELYLATPKPEYVATWNEFQRSGWTDVAAFTIANTLDSAQSHLVMGPIIGAMLGGLAALVILPRSRRGRHTVTPP